MRIFPIKEYKVFKLWKMYNFEEDEINIPMPKDFTKQIACNDMW